MRFSTLANGNRSYSRPGGVPRTIPSSSFGCIFPWLQVLFSHASVDGAMNDWGSLSAQVVYFFSTIILCLMTNVLKIFVLYVFVPQISVISGRKVNLVPFMLLLLQPEVPTVNFED